MMHTVDMCDFIKEAKPLGYKYYDCIISSWAEWVDKDGNSLDSNAWKLINKKLQIAFRNEPKDIPVVLRVKSRNSRYGGKNRETKLCLAVPIPDTDTEFYLDMAGIYDDAFVKKLDVKLHHTLRYLALSNSIPHMDRDECEIEVGDTVIDNYLMVYKVAAIKPQRIGITNAWGSYTVDPKNLRILKKNDGSKASWEDEIK